MTKQFDIISCQTDELIEVVDDETLTLYRSSIDLINALDAIRARLKGEFDNPNLLAFGPLLTTEVDCLDIAERAITKAKGA